jgi:hypothetical protein
MKRMLILLAISIVSAGNVHPQAIWNVYEDGTGDAPTIAAAADSASDGDWILVHSGIYYEEDIVFDGKNVNIDVFSGESVYLVAPVQGAGTCITISNAGSAFLLHSLNIRGYAQAVSIQNASPVIEYVILEDCSIALNSMGTSSPTFAYSVVDSSGTAVSVWGGDGVMLRNLTIVGCDTGVSASAGTVTLLRNILYGNGVAIDCQGAAVTLECNNLHANGTDYTGCTQGTDDFFLDPIFCFLTPPAPYPYMLHEDSPCLPFASPCGVGIWLGFNPNVGCTGEATDDQSWGLIKSLYR